MKTLLQMEMFYVIEYTPTCRFVKIIYSWSGVFSITYTINFVIVNLEKKIMCRHVPKVPYGSYAPGIHMICPMLLVYRDCPFLIGPYVFSYVYYTQLNNFLLRIVTD
jgi:hypothetical protein